MVSVRTLLLWLMLFALPFQGYAAAAMSLCAPDATQLTAQAHTAATTTDHRDHGHGAAPASAGHHADGDVASNHDDAHAGDHKCSNCASCHSAGLPPASDILKIHGLPQADFSEPLYALATRSPGVPDKPPRA